MILGLLDIANRVRVQIHADYERADALENAVLALGRSMDAISALEPIDLPNEWRGQCQHAETMAFRAWEPGKQLLAEANARIRWLEDERVRLERLAEAT